MVAYTIFSDQAYLPADAPHHMMLYPFWGMPPVDPREPNQSRFDRYIEQAPEYMRLTSLEAADIAVLPFPWEQSIKNPQSIDVATQFVQHAQQAGKPVVIFFWHDSAAPVSLANENTIIFRTSLYRSRQRPNVFAMPAWSEDFVECYLNGQLVIRPKQPRPVVGFCGLAATYYRATQQRQLQGWRQRLDWRRHAKHMVYAGKRWLKHRLYATHMPRYTDGSVRSVALQALDNSSRVDTNFVVREHFLGGVRLPTGQKDYYKVALVRQEYVQNMVESDYILCARGAGNFSYRLYETLCTGRIPVFIDTDCVLPFHNTINWKDYCVWVDERNIHRIGQYVHDFHRSLSPEGFEDLQRRCRQLWEEYLSPHGFFRHLYQHFQ
jgi:hypothetical protein